MFRHKIELITMADITEFVQIASKESCDVKLVDDSGFCVNGKSLLGTMAAVEWKSLFCLSSEDIYSKIQKFCTTQLKDDIA